MAQKIITLADFKRLYHEDVAKGNLKKADRQKQFSDFWESLPDYVEGGENGVVPKRKKKTKV